MYNIHDTVLAKAGLGNRPLNLQLTPGRAAHGGSETRDSRESHATGHGVASVSVPYSWIIIRMI